LILKRGMQKKKLFAIIESYRIRHSSFSFAYALENLFVKYLNSICQPSKIF